MKVNIQDLFQYHSSISKELNEKIDSLIKNSNFIQGAEVEEFEKEFALKIEQSTVYRVQMEQMQSILLLKP